MSISPKLRKELKDLREEVKMLRERDKIWTTLDKGWRAEIKIAEADLVTANEKSNKYCMERDAANKTLLRINDSLAKSRRSNDIIIREAEVLKSVISLLASKGKRG